MKNLSYISKFSYEVVRQQVGQHNAKLEKIRSVLAEKGEGMAEAIEYQKEGAAWKRKQVLAECEEWMNATNCPSYLREENRRKAFESCDNDYITKVATAFSGLKLNLETEVEVNSEGEWLVAEKLANEMLREIDKDTVDFYPNFDDTEMQPVVLPSRIPNILVNGADGIAVGMATNIPPHNLAECLNGCIALMDNPDITVDELMEYLPAPDYPTGGVLMGRAGIKEAYKTTRTNIMFALNSDEGCKRIIVTIFNISLSRQTFETNCYHKGIDVKILSRLLGHADVNITYNLYIHLYGDGFDEMYSVLVGNVLQ